MPPTLIATDLAELPPDARSVLYEPAIRFDGHLIDEKMRGALSTLLPRLTRSTPGIERRRAFMLADAAIRVIVPLALEETGWREAAAQLRAIRPIIGTEAAREGRVMTAAVSAACERATASARRNLLLTANIKAMVKARAALTATRAVNSADDVARYAAYPASEAALCGFADFAFGRALLAAGAAAIARDANVHVAGAHDAPEVPWRPVRAARRVITLSVIAVLERAIALAVTA